MKKAVVCLIWFSFFVSSVLAENVNLFWDANSEPNVITYNVYRGIISSGPYVVIGTSPQGLDPIVFTDVGVDFSSGNKFYVVTALDTAGSESNFSDELEVVDPTSGQIPPSAPVGLGYTITTTTTTTTTVGP